jgi:tRNA(Arg) A34 adenosine deaminase TadA
MCRRLHWARIKAIYYGCSASDAARAGFDDAFSTKSSPGLVRRFAADYAASTRRSMGLLAAWIGSPNKIEY